MQITPAPNGSGFAPLCLDLFCGAGGSSTGIALLGYDVLGVDYEVSAARVHEAAGHATVVADITAELPFDVRDRFDLAWASPPCTAFSNAGRKQGYRHAERLVEAILAEDFDQSSWADVEPAVWASLPTLQVILAADAPVVCCENVQGARAVFDAYATVLRRHGYHADVVILQAEQFGVAQTRRRCFLMASKAGHLPPQPTHQKYVKGQPAEDVVDLLGTTYGWISMAEALGWPGGWATGQETVRGEGMRKRHGARPLRPAEEPSEVISGKARSWTLVGMDRRANYRDGEQTTRVVGIDEPSPSLTSAGLSKGVSVWSLRGNNQANAAVRREDEPAPTVAFGHAATDWKWTAERPATTIAGDARVFPPGGHLANDGRDNSKMVGRSENTIRIEVAEAARLQAFPNGHPFAEAGSRTKQFLAIGNACPAPLTAAVVGAAARIDWQPLVAEYLADLYAEPIERD